MPILAVHNDYSRQAVHDIFSPATPFQPGKGAWGMSGIVSIPERPGDYVFFVTYGQSQSGHEFEESITADGVLTWQSQPSQQLLSPRIQQFIEHDDLKNSIYLFLRTQKQRDYTYLGQLSYLSHDLQRERPVWFQWQIVDWNVPQAVLDRTGLSLSSGDNQATSPSLGITVTPPPEAKRRGTTTAKFRGRRGGNRAEQDARSRALGLAGEVLVVEHEKSVLGSAGRDDLAQQVSHVAKEEGDGAGYDVRSFTPSGATKHIEVKTTRSAIDTPFYISSNEVAFSTSHPSTFHLYRVYAFAGQSASMYVLCGDVTKCLDLDPVSYRATIAL